MTSYSTGHEAERHAAQYLENKGYKIFELNWKTRFCEIDIVAKYKKAVYFIEVKYRSNFSQGSGLDYITSKKLSKMRFAAELWVQANKWSGDYRLGAMEVSGDDFDVTNFVSDWM